jgi:hypothetical protein
MAPQVEAGSAGTISVSALCEIGIVGPFRGYLLLDIGDAPDPALFQHLVRQGKSR